ncbi:FtsH protease activity modulator HflK [Dongia sedimenti]|uniref:Protein HflK n=1 Tax=Dongia sedimenti TaxID=3064282 RepID=A0ABU0YEI8_9PROT|nr:FtsH protease activity modulator HflK [Rhodospirillaceae bacterium R-7]
MAWNNQGGPWGGGGKSPWGRGSGPSGGGGGNRPPDFEEMLRRGQDRMKSVLPGGFGSWRGLGLAVGVLVALWGATGFYVVNPGEVGVETVFGVYREPPVQPGLHWNYPLPIGRVETPDVQSRYSTEIGFRRAGSVGGGTEVQGESLMLTKDENIIKIEAVVLWRIRPDQVQRYLFEIQDPADSVKKAVESAIREIIGQSEFQAATTADRSKIEAQATALAQKMLDSYHAGISVEQVSLQDVGAPQEVIEAFLDVQRASNDATSAVNDAQAYRNKVVQGAQGQAVQMLRQAEAYKAEKIANADGEAQRFLSVYAQYKLDPSLTERRIYLESMQNIFGGMNKVLIDQSAGGTGAVPYLPLDQLLKRGGTGSTGNAPATTTMPQPDMNQQSASPAGASQ